MTPSTDVDVVVVGAGFAGLYAVHRLRDVLGLRVQGFEAASGVGGTWWWNRYPGARCDFESVHYSYSFDDDLQQEWDWSERFSAQPEILAYLEHVADRFDLRRSFRFASRVTSVVWDESGSFWTVGTEDGFSCTAQFVVTAPGNLSVEKELEFPGIETFAGEVHRTSRWPHEPVDFTGRRVGVIGTGSTGIQVIPEVAKEAAHLTVFQRTAPYAAPLGNRPTEPGELDEVRSRYAEIRAQSRANFIGAPYEAPDPSAVAATPEERREMYERYWEGGGFRLVISTYQDLLTDRDANETIAEFFRDKIRETVDDPEVAELLCPHGYAYATRRAPFGTEYYETFNRDDVTLVDVRCAPIVEVTERGVRTTDAEYELDVLVLATGFDALTGPLTKMGIVGRGGVALADTWKDGARTYLGLGVHGFPNLFTITGPQSAIALYNNPLAIEDHVEFASRAIACVREAGAGTIEPTAEAEERWRTMVNGIADLTLFPETDSWYMGANIPGKPRTVLFFAGGAPLYRAVCAEVEANGYAGYAIDGGATEVPPLVELDPAVAFLIGAMLSQGAKPLEECSLEEVREALEGFALLQGPKAALARVVEATYPSATGDRPARIFVPEGEGPFGVLVFLHPGGWVGGSVDLADGPCRTLAADLGAIVVAPSYRLAPEDPFPAAADDAFAALRWVADTIAEHGGDPSRLAIAGESAGGNLAAVAAQLAREESGPALVAQVLLYPPVDAQGDAERYPSRGRYANGPILSAVAADGLWAQYLGDRANGEVALASPILGELAGLPPTLVVSVGCDPLRDEAEAYGRALAEAGVPAEVRRVEGLVHASLNLAGQVPRAREIFDAVEEFLAPRIGSSAPAKDTGQPAGAA